MVWRLFTSVISIWFRITHLFRIPPSGQSQHIGILTLAMGGVLTPQKWANTTNQFFSFENLSLNIDQHTTALTHVDIS